MHHHLRVLLVLCSFSCAVIARAEPAHDFPRQLSDTDSASPTPSLPSPTSPPFPTSAFLVFHQIPQLTACSNASINWVYSGPDTQLKLVITNSNVSQSSPAVSPIPLSPRQTDNTPPSGVSETITTSADSTGMNFSWSIVNVPQGYYVIRASAVDPSIALKASSLPFFVTNGTDTSCLAAASSSSSSSPLPTSSQDSSPTAAPLPVGKSKVNGAAIAGGIIGGLMLVAIIVALIIHNYRRSSSSISSSAGRWGGLSSNNSRYGPSSGPPSKPRSNFRAMPTERQERGIPETFGDSPVTGPLTATPGTNTCSDEDVTVTSPSVEKFVSPSKWSDLDAITPLPYSRRRSSTSSNHNHTRSWDSKNPPTSLENAHLARRRSADYRLTLSHSLGASTDYPPGAEMVPIGRSVSSGSTRAAVRRTPRKPVPQYDPTDVQHGSWNSTGTQGSEWFGGAESAQSYGYGPLHEENMGQMAKPMHYLIPDMPSQSR